MADSVRLVLRCACSVSPFKSGVFLILQRVKSVFLHPAVPLQDRMCKSLHKIASFLLSVSDSLFALFDTACRPCGLITSTELIAVTCQCRNGRPPCETRAERGPLGWAPPRVMVWSSSLDSVRTVDILLNV